MILRLCWKYRAYYDNPQGDWELLVDARDGQIRRAKDVAAYDNGTGHRYIGPDPLTNVGATYGDPGYTDGGDANTAQLQAQRVSQSLLDITNSGFPLFQYSLTGPWVHLQDIEAPAGAPVTQILNSDFSYTRDAQAFEDVNCYYHIDAAQRWMQSLGFNTIQHASIAVDPHGFNGADNSHYVGGGNYIAFGEGGVDDAEDADVIWHEYGHAIQHSQVAGWGGGEEGAMGEGFGDYFAASYSRTLNAFRNNWVFNWDGHNAFWGGRTLDQNKHYPESWVNEVHADGEIWSQGCYDAETQLGRSVMDYLVLQHHFLIGSSASMYTAAQALLTADINAYNGLHLWALADAFVPRGLLSRPANDVCGGYSIFSLPYGDAGSTATADNNYANCIGTASPDVIYTLQPQICPTNVTVSLCGSTYDTGLEVRTGGACPGASSMGCSDDFCGGPPARQSQVSFLAAAGTTYYIVIHGYSTYAGSYTLNVSGTLASPVPANDTCPGTAIATLPYSDAGSTCTAANNYANCVNSTSRDVFYNLTLASCQTVTASLCGSGYDTAIEVRRGGGCPGAQPVACDDDACGLQSQVSFCGGRGRNVLYHCQRLL